MHKRSRRPVGVSLAAFILLSGLASAEDVSKAKRLYLSGTKHFDLGEYQGALDDFKEGFRQKDDPVFLYNIAQCYRLLNNNDEAIRFYKTYLRKSPDALNRDEVQRKIASLEEARASQDKARTTPPTDVLQPRDGEPPAPEAVAPATAPTPKTATTLTVQPAPHRKPLYKQWWLWTTVGAVVIVGVAVTVGVVAGSGSPNGTSPFPAVQF
jgi:tetratricopeptide (TPR) repeat protein